MTKRRYNLPNELSQTLNWMRTHAEDGYSPPQNQYDACCRTTGLRRSNWFDRQGYNWSRLITMAGLLQRRPGFAAGRRLTLDRPSKTTQYRLPAEPEMWGMPGRLRRLETIEQIRSDGTVYRITRAHIGLI